MKGKHTERGIEIQRLEETIRLKEKEISDIKSSVSSILLEIKNTNESNNYSASGVQRRKISEICTDTIHELLIDEEELSTTNQSNR